MGKNYWRRIWCVVSVLHCKVRDTNVVFGPGFCFLLLFHYPQLDLMSSFLRCSIIPSLISCPVFCFLRCSIIPRLISCPVFYFLHCSIIPSLISCQCSVSALFHYPQLDLMSSVLFFALFHYPQLDLMSSVAFSALFHYPQPELMAGVQ